MMSCMASIGGVWPLRIVASSRGSSVIDGGGGAGIYRVRGNVAIKLAMVRVLPRPIPSARMNESTALIAGLGLNPQLMTFDTVSS